jgi:excisionase family DNA binding protein
MVSPDMRSHTPHLLTIRQASELLGVHYYTAREWVANGRLPSVAFGPRTRRIPADLLGKLVRQMTTGGN